MILEVDKESIFNLVCKQVENSFTISETEKKQIENTIDETLDACEENFLNSTNKYFTTVIEGKLEAYFSPFHSVQWMVFLYYLGNRIFKNGGGQNL